MDFVEFRGVDLGETPHQCEQGERVEAGSFAARGPDDGGERVVAVQLDDIDVIARLAAGAEREGFVRGKVEKVQAAAEQRVFFHGEKTERGVGGPVDLDAFAAARDDGFAKACGLQPVAARECDFVTGGAERGDIGIA